MAVHCLLWNLREQVREDVEHDGGVRGRLGKIDYVNQKGEKSVNMQVRNVMCLASVLSAYRQLIAVLIGLKT